MWTALIGPIANIAGSWIDGKVEQTKAKAATNVAKAKAEAVIMEKKATGEIDWDLEMAKGSHSSWKDEWLVILFSILRLRLFFIRVIPNLAKTKHENMKTGFQEHIHVVLHIITSNQNLRNHSMEILYIDVMSANVSCCIS